LHALIIMKACGGLLVGVGWGGLWRESRILSNNRAK
jgi:hypothetical protein